MDKGDFEVKRVCTAFCFFLTIVLLSCTALSEGTQRDYAAEFNEMSIEELEEVSSVLSTVLNEKRKGNAKLYFTEENSTVAKGKSRKLSVTAEGREITRQTQISYASSDETIAAVKNGAVTGVAPGTAEITAKAVFEDGAILEAVTTCTVVVPVTGLKAPKEISVFVNEEINVKEMISFSPADTTETELTCSISDESVASVENGVIKGIKGGKAVLTISSGNAAQKPVSARCNVTVQEPVSSISIGETEIVVGKKKTVKLEPKVLPESATNRAVVWSSGDSKIASVSNTGVVTGVSGGTTTITCTAKDGSGITATAKVKVITAVSSIKTDAATVGIIQGKTRKIKTTVLPADATNSNLDWKSSDTSIATVSTTGEISAKKTGKCTITASAQDGSGTAASITVYVEPASPVTVEEIRWSTFFGLKDGHMGVVAKNHCEYLKVKSFKYTVTCSSMYGFSSQREELTYNGKTISPGKQGKSKMSKYVVSGFTTAYSVEITVTSVTFTDGTTYDIPSAAQDTSHFGM